VAVGREVRVGLGLVAGTAPSPAEVSLPSPTATMAVGELMRRTWRSSVPCRPTARIV